MTGHSVGRHRPTTQDCRLEPGERVLLRSGPAAGTTVVLTDRALSVDSAGRGRQRWRWIDIAAVEWDESRAALVVDLWPDAAGNSPRIAVPAAHRLASAAAEAVLSSQLVVRRIRLPGSTTATAVALRQPGASDVVWRVVPAPGLDRDTDTAVEQALGELQSLAGF